MENPHYDFRASRSLHPPDERERPLAIKYTLGEIRFDVAINRRALFGKGDDVDLSSDSLVAPVSAMLRRALFPSGSTQHETIFELGPSRSTGRRPQRVFS